jgi:hypothetical protein
MGNRFRFLKAIFLIGLIMNVGIGYGQRKKGIEYSGFFDTYYFRGPINITAAGGLTSFNGDICPLLKECNSWYASVGASYQVWPRTYFGGDISYFTFKGSRDKYFNYSFDAKGLNADAWGRFLLLDRTVTRHGQLRDRPFRIRPYIQTGIGIYHTLGKQINTIAPVTDTILARDSTVFNDIAYSGYVPWVINIPVGVGFQIWLSHRVSLMPEVFYRFAFTDRLDGISLNSDKSKMDGFFTFGLKIQYTPQAPRVRTKKKSLQPPDEYTGPKGTDYPRKRKEESKPAAEPLPDENAPQEGQPQEGTEGGDQQQPQDGQQQDNQQQQQQQDGQQKDNDGWGW